MSIRHKLSHATNSASSMSASADCFPLDPPLIVNKTEIGGKRFSNAFREPILKTGRKPFRVIKRELLNDYKATSDMSALADYVPLDPRFIAGVKRIGKPSIGFSRFTHNFKSKSRNINTADLSAMKESSKLLLSILTNRLKPTRNIAGIHR